MPDLIFDPADKNPIIPMGLALAEKPEAEGGWAEYFMETDYGDARIEDPYLKASTALMLQNAKEWLVTQCGARRDATGKYRITEATRSAMVGGFSDYLFPLIRASFPVNPINDLVSVQPTNRRIATVVYWNWIYATNKGSIAAGTRAFDANVGRQDAYTHYTDNYIDLENTGTGTGASGTYTGTLQFNDGGGIAPGTVQITTTTSGGVATFNDNGAGNWVGTFTGGGTITTGSSSINYSTGAFTIVIATETYTAVAVNASYYWGSEGSSLIPQFDVQITTTTAEVQRRALQIQYSMEAMFDVNAEFGVDIEPNLISGAAENLNYEIARQLIAIMWNVASTSTAFPITPPSNNISFQQHFMDIVYYLEIMSNTIWQNTQKAWGNWIILDTGAANVVESMASTLFERSPRPDNVMGIHKIGTLAGKFQVYKDVHLSQLPGASANGNILMGFKGDDFYKAGLVYAPYQLLYTTETIMLANFNAQKGLASRYAVKLVNPNMYVKMLLGS